MATQTDLTTTSNQKSTRTSTGGSLLNLGVKDLANYKEKIIKFDNLVQITKDDYNYYKLSDLININNFTSSDSISLADFSLPIQNEVGLRFMEFDGYIKSYANTGQKFFYKNKILTLFKEVKETFPILYKACKASDIPEVLYTKFDNKITIDISKIYIPDDNLIPVLYEVTISYRDPVLNKDLFIYYNLTKSTHLDITLNPLIKNFILTIGIIPINMKVRDDSTNELLKQQLIKYNSTLGYFYYETFTNLGEKIIDPTELEINPLGKGLYHYKVTIDKTSTINATKIDSSFRYDNSQFDLIHPGSVPPVIKFFDEPDDLIGFVGDNILARGESYLNKFILAPALIPAPLVNDLKFDIKILSGYDHCLELRTEIVPEVYEPVINFIDINKISTEDLNFLIMVYFYKINRNNKIKKTYIYATGNLLDIDLNLGKFDKEYNFKDFFITQFTNYLRMNTDQVPFSDGFKSNVKNFIQTKSFNEEYVLEEIKTYVYAMNAYYGTNFQVIDLTPIEEDNGVFVKLTIQIRIKILEEIITLVIVNQ